MPEATGGVQAVRMPVSCPSAGTACSLLVLLSQALDFIPGTALQAVGLAWDEVEGQNPPQASQAVQQQKWQSQQTPAELLVELMLMS